MKKFHVHLDMIVIVVLLFVISIGGNVYQWQTHGKLHKEYLANKLELTGKHVALINTEIALKDCEQAQPAANPFQRPEG